MSRIPEEAVDAALDVLMDDGHNGIDCRPERNFGVSVRAALEAAARAAQVCKECGATGDSVVEPAAGLCQVCLNGPPTGPHYRIPHYAIEVDGTLRRYTPAAREAVNKTERIYAKFDDVWFMSIADDDANHERVRALLDELSELVSIVVFDLGEGGAA